MTDVGARPTLINVNVRLNHGDDDGPWGSVIVPVMLPWWDDEDIDAFHERAKARALDSLRPFLNNSTHFDADIWLPLEPVGWSRALREDAEVSRARDGDPSGSLERTVT